MSSKLLTSLVEFRQYFFGSLFHLTNLCYDDQPLHMNSFDQCQYLQYSIPMVS